MARARNIKPGFFRNAELVELSFEARLLFIGLWTIADREGRLEDRPKQIKMELFPADNMDCDLLIGQLSEIGMLVRYEHDGKRYLQVVNFCKHQNPHKDEKASAIPDLHGNYAEPKKAQCKHGVSTVQEQCEQGTDSELVGLIPDSLLLIPDPLETSIVASKLAQCPHQEILSIFSEELPDLPQPRVWEGKRADALLARWRWVLADLKKKSKPHDKAAGLEFFRRMFGYISKSDFLMGRKTDWSCSLPWIVEAENFAKIIEGNFEPKEAA